MKPGDYRREYAAYCSALESERYSLHAGLSAQPRFSSIEERYADLWKLEAIEDLRLASEDTPAHFETERAASHRLLSAARLKYLEAETRELTSELGSCEASAQVDWDGAHRAAESVPDLIAAESDAARRRELAARWFDALRPCDDLRAARLESFTVSANALGFDGLINLQENITGLELEGLAASSGKFLEQTAPDYMSRLARWAARQLPPLATNELRYADALFFERAAQFDALFSSGDFRALYDEVMANLRIKVGTQANIKVDTEARPAKRARTACFGISPPEDVRLVVGSSRGGLNWFRSSLQEAVRAQHLAWSSRDLSSRYPEFVHPPDGATGDAYGLLFSGLFHDAAWLEGQRGWRSTEALEVAQFVALRETYEVRRACVALRYWLDLNAAKNVRSEQLAETYAVLRGEATGFQHEGAMHLFDAERASRAAQFLRARLFAAGLREHLRGRFGVRWYAARGAGDELIDLWNTAARYTLEELARLVWGGDLDFDLLASELVAAMGV